MNQLESISQRLSEINRMVMSLFAMQSRNQLAPVFRSPYGEDMIAWKLLNYARHGRFVEVGAFDGRSLSVTYALEQIGWHGLLIEPIPERAEECKKNRTSTVINAALAGRGCSGTAKFEIVEGGPGGMFSRLPDTSKPSEFVEKSDAKKRIVEVPLTTMDNVLGAKYPDGATIDLAVIDVEGGELAVLDGFDLELWKPRLMFIEDNSFGKDNALDKFFADKPYTMIGFVGCNRMYARTDDKELMREIYPTA